MVNTTKIMYLMAHISIFQILSENRMGNDGARAVCDLLSENKTITYVDLKGEYTFCCVLFLIVLFY